MTSKTVVFLTATRADFGKLKSLITATIASELDLEVHIAVTGMHLSTKHGNTVREVEKAFPGIRIHMFNNMSRPNLMELTLAKSIEGLSQVIQDVKPDLLVVHGDRVEALAGAIAGALSNILVAHVEGGEVSGTIDELMRHATSKMSHAHLVANQKAAGTLVQLGESEESIFVIGSPDIDLMSPDLLPSIESTKTRYGIHFDRYIIILLHPVTTDEAETRLLTAAVRGFILQNPESNFILCGPNNDAGSEQIWELVEDCSELKNVLSFPSIRFEYFISLLKNARMILGNSSAGVREAPYLSTPCINLGTRQNLRAESEWIIDVLKPTADSISSAAHSAGAMKLAPHAEFGDGNSGKLFAELLTKSSFWALPIQKTFVKKA